MVNLVFLPATEPGDATYGGVPERISGLREVSIHTIQYQHLVWYNKSVRAEAVAQIHALNVSPIVLVGFSESGLGAWNIAREIPDLIEATIIFDAPVARRKLPPWQTAPFYDSDESWREDLPLDTMKSFLTNVLDPHRLVLLSGIGFHDEMCQLSDELKKNGYAHVFLPGPDREHRWDSGWVEEGLKKVVE